MGFLSKLFSRQSRKDLSGLAAAMVKSGNLARDKNDWEGAASAYKQALDLQPVFPEIWVQYGHSLKETGRAKIAVEAYNTAIKQSPNEAETYVHLAHLLKTMGKTAQAVETFQEAYRLNPEDKETFEELMALGHKPNALPKRRKLEQRFATGKGQAIPMMARAPHLTPISATTNPLEFGVSGLPAGRVAAWVRLPEINASNVSAGLWINGELSAVQPLPQAAEGEVVDLVFDLPASAPAGAEVDASVGLITLDDAPTAKAPLSITSWPPANAYQSEFALPPVEPLKDFGIITFGFTRTYALELVLESLYRQGACGITEVWIDGHQGNSKTKEALINTHEMVERYPVAALRSNRGNFGFRKMMLQGLQHMTNTYKRFVVIEDDCFPTGQAAEVFYKSLCDIENDERIFSVYGHHFLTPSEGDTCNRFQGWGWGTTAEKMRPLLNELIECFSMTEQEYLAFVDKALTPEVEKHINVTPNRQPTDTLRRFFAWDETLTMLTGRRGMVHMPTTPRVIYNFGAGPDSTHFTNIDWYRKPPFNMIKPEEVWDKY